MDVKDDTNDDVGEDINAWENRKSLPYYSEAERLVRAWCADAKSIIDIGAGPTLFINRFQSISTRTVMDKLNPPIWAELAPPIIRIVAPFPEVRPPSHDVVLCLQVLEHVLDQWAFVQNLKRCANRLVVVSIPYKWENAGWHSGYSEKHLKRWFEAEADELAVSGCERLVAAYRVG